MSQRLEDLQEILEGEILLSSTRDLLDQKLREILRTENLEERKAKISELVRETREKLNTIRESVRFANVVKESPLSAREYVLPSALAVEHSKLMERFRRGHSVEKWPDKGLLLYGSPGTGKTEYIRFFMHELGDKVMVLKIDIPAITNSPSPGQSIRELYEQAQSQAEKQGKYVVLFFDEFEHLVRSFVSKAASIKRQDDAYGESSARHSSEEKKEFTVDKKGEEALSELKTVLSGTGTLQKVFTICTSNEEDFNSALIRDGRLRAVQIDKIFLDMNEWDVRARTGMALWEKDFTVLKTIQLLLAYVQATLIRLDLEESKLMEFASSLPTLLSEMQKPSQERLSDIYRKLLSDELNARVTRWENKEEGKKSADTQIRNGRRYYLNQPQPLSHKGKQVTLQQMNSGEFTLADLEKILDDEHFCKEIRGEAVVVLYNRDLETITSTLFYKSKNNEKVSVRNKITVIPSKVAAKVKEFAHDKNAVHLLSKLIFRTFFSLYQSGNYREIDVED